MSCLINLMLMPILLPFYIIGRLLGFKPRRDRSDDYERGYRDGYEEGFDDGDSYW